MRIGKVAHRPGRQEPRPGGLTHALMARSDRRARPDPARRGSHSDDLKAEPSADPVLRRLDVGECRRARIVHHAEPGLEEPLAGIGLVQVREPHEDRDEEAFVKDELALLILAPGADLHGLKA